ncbi:MAG TPA: vitamin K epoxide reductase family protein [Patescibacteria group bacterium]|nr:vitamin K epoxide reductase family protein [Patescibacteria group bacterium]
MHLVKNRHLIPALVLSFLGFIDASYLTIVHYRDALPNCSILKGCDIVTTSALSTIGGIPIALFGALFYLALSFFAILIITHPHKTWVQLFSLTAYLGFLVSLFLFLLQIIVLRAICQYCIGSEIISFLIYLFAINMVRHVKKVERQKS